MARKPPRRTAERILETSLALFNRFGEPNVSTTLIAGELGISAGNLYYHYPAKEGLVNALVDRHAHALAELLGAASSVQDVEDAWFFLHALFEGILQYRFIYRDLNELLSRNRHVEQGVQAMLQQKTQALHTLLDALQRHGTLTAQPRELEVIATQMLLVLCYWLSFEYARAPRSALQDGDGQAELLRGARQALGLLAPHLEPVQREHLGHLLHAYDTPVQ